MPHTLFFLMLLVACAPGVEEGDSLPPPDGGSAESTMTGMVRIVGSAPVNVQVVLQPAGESAVRLVGPLVEELSRLAAAEVMVRGRVASSPDPLVSRQIDVSSYDVVSVNGRSVVMGEIVSIAGGTGQLRTADGDEVTLAGVPASFAVGQKVWVQGVQSLAVQSYGTVRP